MMERRTDLRSARVALTVAFAFCVAVGIAGILISVVGEWDARRQLPPEMRSPEAIQYHFDGSVCLACEIWGRIFLVGSIVLGVVVAFIWVIFELAQPRGADRPADK